MFVSTAKVSIKREILRFGQKYLPKGLAIPKESATFAVLINLVIFRRRDAPQGFRKGFVHQCIPYGPECTPEGGAPCGA